jgi:hypothetical protein
MGCVTGPGCNCSSRTLLQGGGMKMLRASSANRIQSLTGFSDDEIPLSLVDKLPWSEARSFVMGNVLRTILITRCDEE